MLQRDGGDGRFYSVMCLMYFSGERPARRFSEFVYAPGLDATFPMDTSKIGARRVGEALGLRLPKLLAQFDTPAAIDLSSLPDRFALKSNLLASKRGVFLLLRREGRYYELFRRRDFTEQELSAAILHALRRAGRPADTPVIAEEFIVGENGPDEIPYDYKLYTFDGHVACVVQINRNVSPNGIAFFGSDFSPLAPGSVAALREKSARLGAAIRPANWNEMLDVARRVSLHLDRPFVSIDTYTTGREVVLGEITPKPGGPYYGMWRFSEQFDLELGQLFAEGYVRRGLDIPRLKGLPPVLAMHDAQLHPYRLDKQWRAHLPALRRHVLGRLRSWGLFQTRS